MPELSQVTEFYVEGFTAEGVPYGPVYVLTTPLEEGWEEAEQAREEESARQGAWREAVMRKKDIADEVKWVRDLADERVALVKSIHK